MFHVSFHFVPDAVPSASLFPPSAPSKSASLVSTCRWLPWLGVAIGLIMAALHSRCEHYVFVLFLSSSVFLFFSSPNLSGHRLDVYHTSTHGVALVRI